MIDGEDRAEGSMWVLYAGALAIVLSGAALGVVYGLLEVLG